MRIKEGSTALLPEDALHALRGGKSAALEVLRPHIRRMAAKQYRDFERRLPAWVEREDVEQELTIQVLKSARAWSPARGGGIGMYVGWGSLRRLRRALNHWRGASLHGRESRNPSRAEIAFCRAFGPDVDPLAKAPPVAADQAESADGARVFDALVRGAATTREALVLLALREAGSPGGAARLIAADHGARLECGLRDESEARARWMVKRVVRQLATRLESERGTQEDRARRAA